ncbi:MAG TPA: PKD domain-containing protein [Solirubrobacteraceae bacterium]
MRLSHDDVERSLFSAWRWALACLVAAAALLTLAGRAGAVVVHLPNGKTLSYQPLRGHARLSQFDALLSNLDYNGGPVMGSNTNYAVYWAPSNAPAYPAEYQSGVNQYFEDLAHDSGGQESVESVSAQYNDSSGTFARYSSHFGGPLIDTQPYPANGCKRATICLTDKQLQAELIRYTAEHGLPRDLSHEYFLLTPPGVEDCFEAAGFECSAGAQEEFAVYCAYHGNAPVAGGELIYANDPYVNGGLGCEDGNHPNGKPSDGVIEGGLSHEHNESITDPEPNNAWTDIGGEGGEIGDKCNSIDPGFEFGQPLGQAPNKSPYNQVINGHLYWYQQEWSNQGNRCLQRLTFSGAEPTATFTSEPHAGAEMSFNATGSTATPAVYRYNWQFNDGAPGGHSLSEPVETTGPTVSHTFPKAGTYVVALTVLAQDGTSIGTPRTIVTGDEGPTAAFSSGAAGLTASFSGSTSSDPDGAISEYRWTFGDGSPTATGVAPSHGYTASGTYTVTLTVKDTSGQTTSVSHPVTVAGAGKTPQTISFTSNPPASATVGGPTYHVTATGGGSGNPVVFSIAPAASSVCKVSGATVSFIGAGTCTIDADQAGNETYLAATRVTQSFRVGEGGAPSPEPGPPPSPTQPPQIKQTGGGLPPQPAAAVLAAGPFSPPPPNSSFAILSSTYNSRTGAVTFTQSVADPGVISWLLTFQNGRFGAFAAGTATCKKGFVSLNGRCRPSKVVFGKGSRVFTAPGTASFTVKPSGSALKALRNAFRRRIGIPVTVAVKFQSSRGGSPVSHTRLMFVRLKKR